MSRQGVYKTKTWLVGALVLCALALSQHVAAKPPLPKLETVASGVNIDINQISVSGISAGGFMAHQFHVAHSEHIMGAGIVAGGPYYCAQGTVLGAVTKCSKFLARQCISTHTVDPYKLFGLDPSLCEKATDLAPKDKGDVEGAAEASLTEARKQEADGRISKLANLKNAKIYLFSGAKDAVVPQGVMDALKQFYVDADVAESNITYNRSFPAHHTMVRDSFNKPVGEVVGACQTPLPQLNRDAFIDDCETVAAQQQQKDSCICPPSPEPPAAMGATCPPANKQQACKDLNDVDLAGAILKHIYGEHALKAPRDTVQPSAVKAFDQQKVFGGFSTNALLSRKQASMASEGYVFIPERCKDGRKCKLHVAFHGCLQGKPTGHRQHLRANLFSAYAGYNEWAKQNDIIVLYPQIQGYASSPLNPQECWNWWGEYYTDKKTYHTKHGKQIKAVAQMINILAGGQKLLDVPPN